MKTYLKVCAGLLLALCGYSSAQADSYPNKPIRLIVPFAAGGATDIVSRIVGAKLGERLGTQIMVENRPAGATIVGTELVARSAPDGYTLLVSSPNFSVNPSLYQKLPYDTQADFVPIGLMVSYPLVMVSNPAFPAKSVKDVVALAKKSPGRINYASAGNGSPGHLAGELLKLMAGVNIVHVPYKGNGPAINDLIGGQVQFLFTGMPAVVGHVKDGRLRLLAATGAKRSALIGENVPTVAEGGVDGFEVMSWVGIMGPAGLPKPIVERLSSELDHVLQDPGVRQKLLNMGADPSDMSRVAFGEMIRDETIKWAKVVKSAGIKVDD